MLVSQEVCDRDSKDNNLLELRQSSELVRSLGAGPESLKAVSEPQSVSRRNIISKDILPSSMVQNQHKVDILVVRVQTSRP